MLSKGDKSFSQLLLGSKPIASVYLGAKQGAILLWEAISNCIAGGWWQHGHGWQHGIGWYQKR